MCFFKLMKIIVPLEKWTKCYPPYLYAQAAQFDKRIKIIYIWSDPYDVRLI